MNAIPKTQTFVQDEICLLKLGKLVSSGELATELRKLNLVLYNLGTDGGEVAKRIREIVKCESPLVFAGNKYILPIGELGESSFKPNPLWSEDSVFVVVPYA